MYWRRTSQSRTMTSTVRYGIMFFFVSRTTIDSAVADADLKAFIRLAMCIRRAMRLPALL